LINKLLGYSRFIKSLKITIYEFKITNNSITFETASFFESMKNMNHPEFSMLGNSGFFMQKNAFLTIHALFLASLENRA
jgi:hypothetical protein